MTPGDRALPILPIAPHLRAVERLRDPPQPGSEDLCLVLSRIDGRFPQFDGFVPLDLALAMPVAGEA